jgi:sugar phosphate isomerase/epimerase
VAEYAALLRREGYEAVQLAIPKAFTGVERYEDITEALCENIREEFEKQKIEIAVMGCYMDLGNPDAAVRTQAVETFKFCLRMNRILGARVVGSETAYPHLTKMEKHQWFAPMMESLKELRDEAERLDVWMAIEPVGWHPLEDVETAREVLDTLGSDHVKIIFDPANVLERPALISQSAYWDYCLKLLGADIEAIHLKDFTVDGSGAYIPKLLGEGDMDYRVLQSWLRTRPDMPVLREEMDPATAAHDLGFMRKFVS